MCPAFNISVWLENAPFWPLSTNFSEKNKVRFFFFIIYVDMYITKHVSAFILCFPERFDFALDVIFHRPAHACSSQELMQ